MKLEIYDWMWTAMHFAAVLSDRCLKELIKHPNVDLNSVTFVNYTPLLIAIHNEKVPQTQILLEIDDVDLNIIENGKGLCLDLHHLSPVIKNKNGFSVELFKLLQWMLM